MAGTSRLRNRCRRVECAAGLALTVCVALLSAGCGPRQLPSKVLFGSVTCGGEKVPTGAVCFVPVGGARPNCAAAIVDGQYRIRPAAACRWASTAWRSSPIRKPAAR